VEVLILALAPICLRANIPGMANFVQVGSRIVNLDLVCAAERRGRGAVTIFFTAPDAAHPMSWTFEDQHEADVIWLKLVPRRGDLTDLEGGPYSITDNEQTESFEPPPSHPA
jgi:hypothetical protein